MMYFIMLCLFSKSPDTAGVGILSWAEGLAVILIEPCFYEDLYGFKMIYLKLATMFSVNQYFIFLLVFTIFFLLQEKKKMFLFLNKIFQPYFSRNKLPSEDTF